MWTLDQIAGPKNEAPPRGTQAALLRGFAAPGVKVVATDLQSALSRFDAQSFPAAGLAPLGDPFAFAQVQAFISYLCATVHVAHAHRMRGHRWADDPAAIAEMRRKARVRCG